MVNKQLIEDTFRLLQTEMSPIAGIQLHLSPAECEQLLPVLERHDLEYNRKVHLLGIYTILTMAAGRHMDCVPHHPDLTRNILDGDYLYSFYLQFAVKCRELDLVAYLAPSIKKCRYGVQMETSRIKIRLQELKNSFSKSKGSRTAQAKPFDRWESYYEAA